MVSSVNMTLPEVSPAVSRIFLEDFEKEVFADNVLTRLESSFL